MPPLVVLGLDSGDADLLRDWAGKGLLPSLASLLARGAHARIAGPEMVSAHGVWMTLFSGVSIRDHGHYLRRPLRPGSYALGEPDWSHERAPPFWASFRGRDAEIAVVDAPETRPLAGIRGLQVAGWATHPTPETARAEPAGSLGEVRRVFGERIRTDESQRGARRDERELRRILERVARKGALVRSLLDGRDPALIVVVSGDSHAAAHRFSRYRRDGDDRAGGRAAVLATALQDVYRAIDGEIGLLLERVPDANVCVVANNGIRDGYPTGELTDAFCHRLGYQVEAAPRSIAERALALRGRGLAPGVRRLLDRALPAGTRRRLDDEWFRRRTDWSRTTAFAVPSHYTTFLRVNLRGREPEGCVPPDAYAATLDRLEADLRVLVDEASGEPVIRRVTRTVEAFGGGPPELLPDLVAEWQAGDLVKRIRHPRAVLERKRSGDPRGNHHSRTGLLIAAGPAIEARGDVGEISPLDVAPLFRTLAGESPRPEERAAALDAFRVRSDRIGPSGRAAATP